MVIGSARRDVRAVTGLVTVAIVWTIALAAAATVPSPLVGAAAAIDLSVTAAVALYVIAVHGGHLPRWTLTATLAIGMLVGKLVLARGPDLGHAAMATAAALEVAALAMLAVRARRAYRAWRSARALGAETLDALEAMFAATGFPPRMASVVATELAVVAAGVTGWRTPARAPARFTVHRVNGWLLYLGVFLFLLATESAVVHLLLAVFASATAAWLATGLAAYSALWLVGDAHAVRHGGVILGERALEIRIGVRWRGSLPWATVAAVALGAPPAGAIDASVLGGNVVLHLREPCELRGVFGRRRAGRVLALSLDEPERFIAAASARLSDRSALPADSARGGA